MIFEFQRRRSGHSGMQATLAGLLVGVFTEYIYT